MDKKILAVDDDVDILDALEVVLTMEDYDVETIAKGEEVYKMVENFQPDLIILDVLLSGNDGRTICKKLKSDNKTKRIPVIMISAHPSAKESVREVGANAFLAKPFDIDELLQEVKKFLL
jgi:DNA-binding response OmpR family regulator